MDPYRTLGVSRDCTREEVKDAFRARVASAHPDRGGDDLTFIQLRSAYEQILAELDRYPRPRPDGDRPSRAHRHEGGPHDKPVPKSPDPLVARQAYVDLLYRISPRQRNWGRNFGAILFLTPVLYLPVSIPVTILFVALLGMIDQIIDLDKTVFQSVWIDSNTRDYILMTVFAIPMLATVLLSVLLARWIMERCNPS